MTQLLSRNIVTFIKGAFQLLFQLKIQKTSCVKDINYNRQTNEMTLNKTLEQIQPIRSPLNII